MTLINHLQKWLPAPPIPARWALAGMLAALAVPTLVRLLVDGDVTGSGFSPYTPSVLLCAVLLGWQYAALIALASAALGDALFVGPRYHVLEGPSDLFGILTFLLNATLIICLVQAIRSLVRDWRRTQGTDEEPDEPVISLERDWRGTPGRGVGSSGLVISLESGEAWASWYGDDTRIRLGPQEEVAAMMQDFLAQLEVGKRLSRDA